MSLCLENSQYARVLNNLSTKYNENLNRLKNKNPIDFVALLVHCQRHIINHTSAGWNICRRICQLQAPSIQDNHCRYQVRCCPLSKLGSLTTSSTSQSPLVRTRRLNSTRLHHALSVLWSCRSAHTGHHKG